MILPCYFTISQSENWAWAEYIPRHPPQHTHTTLPLPLQMLCWNPLKSSVFLGMSHLFSWLGPAINLSLLGKKKKTLKQKYICCFGFILLLRVSSGRCVGHGQGKTSPLIGGKDPWGLSSGNFSSLEGIGWLWWKDEVEGLGHRDSNAPRSCEEGF